MIFSTAAQPALPAPEPPPNLAITSLMVELKRLEGKHSEALRLKYWHEQLAFRQTMEVDRISGERQEIERAISAIKAAK